MKNIVLILCSLLICGCSVNKIYIAPQMLPFVSQFEKDMGIYPYGISMEFVTKLPGDTVGLALVNKPRVILILKSYWNESQKYGKEQLLYHELGHMYGLEHDDRTDEYRCPISIMNSVSFGDDECYSAHHNELIQELKAKIYNKIK